MIPRDEADFNKQESSTSDNTKASSSSTTSWTRLKDPRVVRVSRAFGGKDRHSKVCTVRGLRDRRVRLSVPTAIQLYDLQERLGLNQPSKVVDWLLNAAKHEIDELPPLQIPQGTFSHNLDPIIASHDFRLSQLGKHGLKTATGESNDWSDHMKHFAPGKSKEVSRETREEETQLSLENNNQGVFVSSNNFPFKQNPSSFPYNSPFVRWDPSNLTLSHIPPRSHGLLTTQQELDWHNMNFPSGSHHQVLVYHQAQPSFPSQIVPTNTEFDPKQMSFQGSQLSPSSLSPHVDSTTQLVRPIDFNMTVNLLPSQNNEGS